MEAEAPVPALARSGPRDHDHWFAGADGDAVVDGGGDDDGRRVKCGRGRRGRHRKQPSSPKRVNGIWNEWTKGRIPWYEFYCSDAVSAGLGTAGQRFVDVGVGGANAVAAVAVVRRVTRATSIDPKPTRGWQGP